MSPRSLDVESDASSSSAGEDHTKIYKFPHYNTLLDAEFVKKSSIKCDRFFPSGLRYNMPWYTFPEGITDLFRDLEFEEYCSPKQQDDKNRVFTAKAPQYADVPAQKLEWSEFRGQDIIVRSLQSACIVGRNQVGRNKLLCQVPTATAQAKGLRYRMAHLMDRIQGCSGIGCELGLVFDVEQILDTPMEAVWRLTRKPVPTIEVNIPVAQVMASAPSGRRTTKQEA